MVTAPEDNRNFFILKPLLDEVVDELGMCPLRKLIPRTGVELHVTYPQGPDRFLSSVIMTLSLQLQKIQKPYTVIRVAPVVHTNLIHRFNPAVVF
jgi:hypothetical protein